MHIEYRVSEDDFVSAARLAMRTRSKSALFWTYAVAVFGVILIAGSVISMIATHSFTAGMASLLWGSFLVCLPLLRNYQFRKQYRKNSLLHQSRILHVNDTQVGFKTASSEGTTDWSVYTRFCENQQTFVLFQQGNQIFIPIPKRELSAEEASTLRALFKAYLDSGL